MMDEYIKKETAYRAIMGERPEAREPCWFAELVLEIPAADVAPVRHGRLGLSYCEEYYGPFADGKECGTYNIIPCNYCRVCGARMDLEV